MLYTFVPYVDLKSEILILHILISNCAVQTMAENPQDLLIS